MRVSESIRFIVDYRKGTNSFEKEIMSNVKFFAILIALLCFTNELILSEAVKYCYSDDEHPYLLAGTKTAYEVEHGIIKNTTVPSE